MLLVATQRCCLTVTSIVSREGGNRKKARRLLGKDESSLLKMPIVCFFFILKLCLASTKTFDLFIYFLICLCFFRVLQRSLQESHFLPRYQPAGTSGRSERAVSSDITARSVPMFVDSTEGKLNIVEGAEAASCCQQWVKL